MKKINLIPPFKSFILQNFPFIEEDFDALTNYELLCHVVNYIKTMGNEFNNIVLNVEELENWFNNLDVQDEIDNKLDEMAESGQLAEIISQYLQTQVIFSFNSINDMINAENLYNGSFVETYGFYNVGDGGSAKYKIRTITNEDTVNNMTLFKIENSDTLVAELVKTPKIINAKQYGLNADGNDCSVIFNKIIDLANTENRDIYLPSGTYKISNDLHPIKAGKSIYGDPTLLNDDNETKIDDYRESTNFLFDIKKINDEGSTGGGIQNITFVYRGETVGCSCINLEDTLGWTSLFENLKIIRYKGHAIKTKFNDCRFTNCLIHHCGIYDNENSTPIYAVYLTENSNEIKFINCHFETCRYVIKTDGNTFLNGLYNTKIEMDPVEFNNTITDAPLYIESNNTNQCFTIDGCSLINLDIEEYSDGESDYSYANVPAFIYSTKGKIMITNNNFTCGGGAGTALARQSNQSKFVDIRSGIISNNIFNKPSYKTPAVSCYLATCSNNVFYPVTGGTYAGTPDNECLIKNEYESKGTLGNNNRIISSIFVTPYLYNDKYEYRDTSTGQVSYNVPINANTNAYNTLVIKQNKSTANLFGLLKINFTQFKTNKFRGYFLINAYRAGTTQSVSLVDDSCLIKDSSYGVIYVGWKDGNLYVQVPTSGNQAILFTVEGLEGQDYSAYVDRTQNSVIQNFASSITINNTQ